MSEDRTLGLPDPVLCDENAIPLSVRSREFRRYVAQLDVEGARTLFERIRGTEPGQSGQRFSTYVHLAAYGPVDGDLVRRYTRAGVPDHVAENPHLLGDSALIAVLFDAILDQWALDAPVWPRASRLLAALDSLNRQGKIPDRAAYRDLIVGALTEREQSSPLVRSELRRVALELEDLPTPLLRQLAGQTSDFPAARKVAAHPAADRATWQALLDVRPSFGRVVAEVPAAVACATIRETLLTSDDPVTFRAALRSSDGPARGAFFRHLSIAAPEDAVSLLEQTSFDVAGIEPRHLEELLSADDRSIRERSQVQLPRVRTSGQTR